MKIMSKKQKRMFKMVKAIQEYVATYDKQDGYLDYNDNCFISDMVYAIGLSLDPVANKWANGFIKYKNELYEWLKENKDKVV